jgi:hypothetical protein
MSSYLLNPHSRLLGSMFQPVILIAILYPKTKHTYGSAEILH